MARDRYSAVTRATKSSPPPAASGTMKRTGRFGQVKSGDGVAGNARCAGAENGQASAAPPRSGMNSRRLKGLIRMCPMPHLPVRGPHRILLKLAYRSQGVCDRACIHDTTRVRVNFEPFGRGVLCNERG